LIDRGCHIERDLLPNIHSEPCECPPGKCAAMFDGRDNGRCVNRLPGGAEILYCERHRCGTWHDSVTGECLHCKAAEVP
jgi:hypothetical protein